MDWLLLALAIYNLIAMAMVFIPRTFHNPNNPSTWLVFIFTLLATELAWFWLPLQVLLALFLIQLGALDSIMGGISLAILAVSWLGLVWCISAGFKTAAIIEKGLVEELGSNYRSNVPAPRRDRFREEVRFADWRRPFHMKHPEVERIPNISYAAGGIRRRLDIYRPKLLPEGGCPVLLQIHGGAFMTGDKGRQALPLMYWLASKGWICVAPNYRLSPSVGFPTHLEDCKEALCWIRTEGKAYGMNAKFVAVTGGSAGGQLAALMALTPNRPELQPTYDNVDTTIQACVPIYGAYDPLHRFDQHPHGETIAQFLVDKVIHESPKENPGLWDLASPIVQISDQSPPFMVIHGSHDSICPATDARMFIKHLREVSKNPVIYAELIGGEHAFDVVHSLHTDNTVDGVHRFLEWTLAQHTAACSSPSQAEKRYENSGC